MAALSSSARPSSTLLELATVFLRLGVTSFGGPAAHIAMMRQELVERRAWLAEDEFLDLLGASNLIPGPTSTELALHLGQRRAGWPGLLVAGLCFILPAALITGVVAFVYLRYGLLPDASAALAGVKPVVLAILADALWKLGRPAVKSTLLAVIGSLALAAVWFGAEQLIVLCVAGIVAMVLGETAPGPARRSLAVPTLALAPVAALGVAHATLPKLFLVFLKIGSLLFGSGYVLFAFLRTELVQQRGWISETQLVDAVAVGQLTPGPLFTTATFVGYLVAGPAGAAVSTVAIFLPAFVLVGLSSHLVPRIRRSPRARRFLDGVNVASLALIALVTVDLGRIVVTRPWMIVVAIAAALVLLRTKLSSAWLIAGGALCGLLVSRLTGHA